MLNKYGHKLPDTWKPGQLWVSKNDPYSYKLIVKDSSVDVGATLRFMWIDRDSFHCRVSSFILREKYSFDEWADEYEYICTLGTDFAVDLKESMEQLT